MSNAALRQHILKQGFGSQEFWYIMYGLDIQLEQSENNNPLCKKICQRLLAVTCHILCFPRD